MCLNHGKIRTYARFNALYREFRDHVRELHDRRLVECRGAAQKAIARENDRVLDLIGAQWASPPTLYDEESASSVVSRAAATRIVERVDSVADRFEYAPSERTQAFAGGFSELIEDGAASPRHHHPPPPTPHARMHNNK